MSKNLRPYLLVVAMLLFVFEAQASDPNIKWEYQVKQYQISGPNTQSAIFLQKSFSEEGIAGWELVHIERWNSGLLVTFKRRKN